MAFTQEDIMAYGYAIPAAPIDDWRDYDRENPVPGYFDFDWLSSRHPDLYHRFALSTVGLMDKLETVLDLTGMTVVDIGAGTGRSAAGLARRAKKVYAIDRYDSVVAYGARETRARGLANVEYLHGDRDALPLTDSSMDAATCAWAEINPREAWRVVRNGGYIVLLGSTADALCGELSPILALDHPWIGETFAPPETFLLGFPDEYEETDGTGLFDVPLQGPARIWRFTYACDYESWEEAAAITGRLYGKRAASYFTDRKQSTFSWRLQIAVGKVAKRGS